MVAPLREVQEKSIQHELVDTVGMRLRVITQTVQSLQQTHHQEVL